MLTNRIRFVFIGLVLIIFAFSQGIHGAGMSFQSSTAGATKVPAAPEDGGPRNWEVTGLSTVLNLREQPSTLARIVAQYTSGTILDNLGCRNNDGRIWCDVQQLGGGPRGYVAVEFLKPAASPDGSVATGPDDSALRAGQGKFDATGKIPCAQSAGQPMMQCEFGVARAGGGYATVVIKKPDGRTRAIFFRMGKPIGVDTSEADGYPEFSATKESDLNFIRVGGERYEIPDVVVLGGKIDDKSKKDAAIRNPDMAGSASVHPLADTRWRLVEFQSMDDATGTIRADDPYLYTMRLNADGTVLMRLNCNHL